MDAARLAAVLSGVGCPNPAPWAEVLAPAMARHEINTVCRQAMFLSNILHETGGLKVFAENLNYSVKGLLKTFGRHRISAADCQRLGRKPGERGLSPERQQEIANLIYGGDWGRRNLGNTRPNDGWFFRGRSLIQLTGRANHTRLAKVLNTDVVKLQKMLDTPAGSAEAACHFWSAIGGNDCADDNDQAEARYRINGGHNGMEDVRQWYDRVEAALKYAEPG